MIKFCKARTQQGVWNVTSFKIKYELRAQPIPIRDSQDAAMMLKSIWDHELINVQEQLAGLYMNAREEAIGFRLISTGKINTTAPDIPLILSCGLLSRASALILAHNHPTGDVTPSRQDIRLTQQLCKTVSLVGMELWDHIILSELGWHSMADAGNFVPDRMLRK